MSKVAQPAVRFTRADYDLLPEGMHVELIDGELLKMAEPTVRHQELARALFVLFMGNVGKRRVFFGPLTFATDDIRQALLVAEVLSPSTADRNVKVEKYLGQGVDEVWLVDPRKETVEVHSRSGAALASGATAIPSRALPGLGFAAAGVFER